MLAHIHPSSHWFTFGLSPKFKSKGSPAQCPDPAQDRQVPRAALPTSGVTIGRSKSRLLSEGVTPPSSLIPAHAPDQNPPSASLCGLVPRVFAGFTSPCWELALPDVSSTVCVEVLGPIPRCVLPVHLPASSRKASASPYEGEVRHAKYPLHYNFTQGRAFRGCSHSLMFRLLNLLDLQVVPTSGIYQGSQALYTTQDLRRYRTQVVASLRTRLGQLVRRDFHPLDCIVVGCYPPRLRVGLVC